MLDAVLTLLLAAAFVWLCARIGGIRLTWTDCLLALVGILVVVALFL